MADPTSVTILPAGPNTSAINLRTGGPTVALIEFNKYDRTWKWTVGLGWLLGLVSFGAAIDALLSDPAFGVDVHNEGK